MSKDFDDYMDSSFGGWPYNNRGDTGPKMANFVDAMGIGGPGAASGGGGSGVMGAKPAAGTAGLGLSQLKQPTQMSPARPVVGPNPLANGGQGPSGGMMANGGNMGGGMRPPIGPVTGMSPGGPIVNPVDTGMPVQSTLAGPSVQPPGLLQGGTPGGVQRSPGFGGIRPPMSY